MKIFSKLFLSLCIFGLASCNDYEGTDFGSSSLTSVQSDKFNVTISDVKNYTKLVCKDDSDAVTKIVPIVVEGMDTLPTLLTI
jgi:hypothetical protein